MKRANASLTLATQSRYEAKQCINLASLPKFVKGRVSCVQHALYVGTLHLPGNFFNTKIGRVEQVLYLVASYFIGLLTIYT